MKRNEAERLLGGYATGTLTEAERRTLFAEALEHQELFDALADEEVLRDLLSDPAAKAQLLAALAPTARPKIVPFWRRPGLLGAAAGLIVAATAGLAYLRSPESLPLLKQEEAKPAAAPAPVPVPSAPDTGLRAPLKVPFAKEVVPLPKVPAPAAQHPPVAPMPPPPVAAVAGRAMAEAQARTQAAGLLLQTKRQEAQERKTEDRASGGIPSGMPGSVPGGVIGGVVGGVVGAAVRPAENRSEAAAPSPPVAMKAKADRPPREAAAKESGGYRWSVEPGTDGMNDVQVTAAGAAQVLILRRGRSGIEVVRLRPEDEGRIGPASWRGRVRLASGDVLDLYVLDGPLADPEKLPETGAVDGFRARIHPAAKKESPKGSGF